MFRYYIIIIFIFSVVSDMFMDYYIYKVIKMSEMQKVSEVFKSNFNYYQRVAHKMLS